MFPYQIQLPNGSVYTLMSLDDFIRLVAVQLGRDAQRFLEGVVAELLAEADYTQERIQTDLGSYEASLDSNRNAFQDLSDDVECLWNTLHAPLRTNRKVTDILRNMRSIIGNQI